VSLAEATRRSATGTTRSPIDAALTIAKSITTTVQEVAIVAALSLPREHTTWSA
jgi:hypothetical protein